MKKIVITIIGLLILLGSLAFATTERYVIYDLNGTILEAGNVNIARDQQWIAQGDTSTTYGHIQKVIQDANKTVVYLEKGDVPSPKTHKISNEKIKDKTPADYKKEEKEKKKKKLKSQIEDINATINGNATNLLKSLIDELAELEEE